MCGCCCGLATCPTCGGTGVVPAWPYGPRPWVLPYVPYPWRRPVPVRPQVPVPGIRFSGSAARDVAAARQG